MHPCPITDRGEESPPASHQINSLRDIPAAAAAAREYDGEQVILFGSQARGMAGPRSDVDLLVVTRPNRPASRLRPGRLTRLPSDSEIGRLLGRTPAHILVMDRTEAEDARGRPGVLGGAALEHGVTVHCEPGWSPLHTGTVYWRMPGGEMVRKTRFRPDEAERLARRSAAFLRTAETERSREPDYACIELQKAGEHMLKALITAKGRQFEHIHDLNTLWDAAEEAGVEIPAARNRAGLEEFTLYAGVQEYSAEPADRPATETLENALPTIRKIVEHGRRTLPAAIAQTTSRLAQTEREAIGTSGPTDHDADVDGVEVDVEDALGK